MVEKSSVERSYDSLVLEDIIAYLCKKYQPKAILLQGSRARGDSFEASDYDITLIAKNPERIRPEYYKGYALDVGGVSREDKILFAGDTPMWPCLVIYDDVDELGKQLAKRTEEAFLHGPPPLTQEEMENRCNYSKRLIDRIQGRGEDPMLRFCYIGLFYQRALRYWCEINHKWTQSAHIILANVASEDPQFYQMFQGLWTEEYLSAATQIHKSLFNETPSKFT